MKISQDEIVELLGMFYDDEEVGVISAKTIKEKED